VLKENNQHFSEKYSQLESAHTSLLLDTATETHERLTSSFPQTASISDMIVVLESDLSGLLLEFLVPFHSSTAGIDIAQTISRDCKILIEFCSQVVETKKSMIWAAAGKSAKRALCQDLWKHLFPVKFMAQCEIDTFIDGCSHDSVWKYQGTKSDFKELLADCIEQILRLQVFSSLSSMDVKISNIPEELVLFNKEEHKSIGSKLKAGTECFIVFPRFECNTGTMSLALVVSSSEILI